MRKTRMNTASVQGDGMEEVVRSNPTRSTRFTSPRPHMSPDSTGTSGLPLAPLFARPDAPRGRQAVPATISHPQNPTASGRFATNFLQLAGLCHRSRNSCRRPLRPGATGAVRQRLRAQCRALPIAGLTWPGTCSRKRYSNECSVAHVNLIFLTSANKANAYVDIETAFSGLTHE